MESGIPVSDFEGLASFVRGLGRSSPQTTTSRSEDGRSRSVAQLPYISTEDIPGQRVPRLSSSALRTSLLSLRRTASASSRRFMNTETSLDNRLQTPRRWKPTSPSHVREVFPCSLEFGASKLDATEEDELLLLHGLSKVGRGGDGDVPFTGCGGESGSFCATSLSSEPESVFRAIPGSRVLTLLMDGVNAEVAEIAESVSGTVGMVF
mmetsp:Transcript_59716/g.146448  ORF Transcript_59716/g.146448 Transcript_59716/m.146448 type:complete len:208 (-) Transcript_59716:3252-3875(-)